jgi:transcriptional regulator GlxA family with amidase domain
MAWTDLGLRIVDRLLGPAVTVATARYMLCDPAGREQRHYSGFAPRLHHGDAPVLRVQHWLQSTGARDVTLAVMAKRACLEQRTILRRFHRATGLKPTEYCQHISMARAREILELSTRTVGQIAWEVGYSDEAALRKVFRRLVGLSPSAYCIRFSPGGLGDPAGNSLTSSGPPVLRASGTMHPIPSATHSVDDASVG